MNATVCTKTEAEFSISMRPVPAEDYTTTPMIAIEPIQKDPEEEMLYASFEEAIKPRISALKSIERCHWEQALQTTFTAPDTDRLPVTVENNKTVRNSTPSPFRQDIQYIWQNRQHIIITTCSALMLIMLGFDIMGLLVLWLR